MIRTPLRNRLVCASLTLAVVAAFYALSRRAATAAEPVAPALSGPVLLYPIDRSAIPKQPTLVMAIVPASGPTPTLTVDGQSVPVQRLPFASNWAQRTRTLAATRPATTQPIHQLFIRDKSDKVMLVAKLELTPGEHRIAIGDSFARVFAATPEKPAPADWAVLRTHDFPKDRPPTGACRQCHNVTGAHPDEVLGVPRPLADCQHCHEEVALQAAHRHVMDSLSRCQTCHDMHGSHRAALLVDTREKLCIRCHEGGHSKR